MDMVGQEAEHPTLQGLRADSNRNKDNRSNNINKWEEEERVTMINTLTKINWYLTMDAQGILKRHQKVFNGMIYVVNLANDRLNSQIILLFYNTRKSICIDAV